VLTKEIKLTLQYSSILQMEGILLILLQKLLFNTSKISKYPYQ